MGEPLARQRCCCIRILAHFGHFHFRCLWKIWPFTSFIGTRHFRQVTPLSLRQGRTTEGAASSCPLSVRWHPYSGSPARISCLPLYVDFHNRNSRFKDEFLSRAGGGDYGHG